MTVNMGKGGIRPIAMLLAVMPRTVNQKSVGMPSRSATSVWICVRRS
ncbi:MAG: hypothetical protein ACF8R9_09940 [Phycisphaerales bacterium JB054]